MNMEALVGRTLTGWCGVIGNVDLGTGTVDAGINGRCDSGLTGPDSCV